jgi:PhnB protein
MSVQPIPKGYHSVTPYLIVRGAADAIEFYKQAFSGQELMRMPSADGRVAHAELQLGDSRVMLADEHPEMEALAPQQPGHSGVGLCLYVADVDRVFAKATQAGAQVKRPLQDQFYGDRTATLVDPFGHVWTISTHIEDVTPDEMQRRMAAMQQQQQS